MSDERTIFWESSRLPDSNYCILCMDNVNLDEHVTIRLRCGHIFHYECFLNLRRPLCCHCRTSIDVPITIQRPEFTVRENSPPPVTPEPSIRFHIRTPPPPPRLVRQNATEHSRPSSRQRRQNQPRRRRNRRNPGNIGDIPDFQEMLNESISLNPFSSMFLDIMTGIGEEDLE